MFCDFIGHVYVVLYRVVYSLFFTLTAISIVPVSDRLVKVLPGFVVSMICGVFILF